MLTFCFYFLQVNFKKETKRIHDTPEIVTCLLPVYLRHTVIDRKRLFQTPTPTDNGFHIVFIDLQAKHYQQQQEQQQPNKSSKKVYTNNVLKIVQLQGEKHCFTQSTTNIFKHQHNAVM